MRLFVCRRQEPGLDLKEPSVCEDVPALLRPRGELAAVGGRNEVFREIPHGGVPGPHNTSLDKRGQDVRIETQQVAGRQTAQIDGVRHNAFYRTRAIGGR